MDAMTRIQEELRESACEGDARKFHEIMMTDTFLGITYESDVNKLYKDLKDNDVFNKERSRISISPSDMKQCDSCQRFAPDLLMYICQQCRGYYCLVCADLTAALKRDDIIYMFCCNECMHQFADESYDVCLMFCQQCMEFRQESDYSAHLTKSPDDIDVYSL